MRRGRIFIFLALILIIILVIAALFLRQFSGQGVPEEPAAPATVDVYVAGQNIPQGSEITSSVITTMAISEDTVNPVMFTVAEQGELVGKWTKYPIEQGVVITSSMVGTKDEIAPSGPAWASGVDIGMTAFSIPVTRLTSVSFGVADGAHVNINACFLFVDVDPSYQTILPNDIAALQAPGPAGENAATLTMTVVNPEIAGNVQGRTEVEPSFQQGVYVVPSEERQRARLVCQMLIQNVKVLRLGTFPLAETVAPADAEPGAAPAAVERPDLITLVVTPQDSVTLSYLIYSGAEINLTLRNASDEQRVATEAATLQFLLSQYNIPVPAKLPYAMQPGITELVQPFLPNDVVTVPPEQ